MQFELKGTAVLTLENELGEGKSRVVFCDANLAIPEGLESKQFFDDDGTPNLTGFKVLTQCFIQGLNVNIHYANSKGLWKDADQMAFIMEELQKAFVESPKSYTTIKRNDDDQPKIKF